MKKIIAIILLSSISLTFAKETPELEKSEYSAKLLKLVNDLTNKADIEKLTKDDIPTEWKTTITQSEDKDFFKKTLNRGKDTVLEISWLKKSHTLKNIKTESFCLIRMTHKKHHVLSVTNNGEEMIIQPSGQKHGYSISTQIEKNGKISLVISGPNEWIEAIELSGIKTTLMNDLEYTKHILILGKVRKLMDHAIHKK
jgi:hypothetical protein